MLLRSSSVLFVLTACSAQPRRSDMPPIGARARRNMPTMAQLRATEQPAQALPMRATPPPADGASKAHCPDEMAVVRRIQSAYCIDRWEASLVEIKKDGSAKSWPGNEPVDKVENEVVAVSVPGKKPQGYISGVQAALACARAGKRLCEIDEWVRACRGPELTLYPYGNERRPLMCNDRFKVLDRHPVVRLWQAEPRLRERSSSMWHPSVMNDRRLHELSDTVFPCGSFVQCTNGYGVYDMVGNLHEWVADPDGTFFGGFFLDTFQNGQGCEYRTTAHPFDYHDYSTGFRCCADLK